MPSPLMHASTGYLIYRMFRGKLKTGSHSLGTGLFLVCVALSLLPDLDSAIGILMGSLARFHNNITHSLFVAAAVGLIFGLAGWFFGRLRPGAAFLMAFLCYGLHVVMDFATVGRGVMALWPVSYDRFLSPVIIFYGLHWSDGFYTVKHLWTVLTESSLLIAVFLGFRVLRPVRAF